MPHETRRAGTRPLAPAFVGRPSRPLRRFTALAAVAGVTCVACAPPSKQDIETAQAIAQLGDSYNDVRLTQQELQDQIDSLKAVVVRQDSIIHTLANLAGVQAPR